MFAGNAARRKGGSSSRTKAATFSDATPIAEAVQACCQLLGRSPGAAEAELAQRLEQNWFSTAEEAASMSEVRLHRSSSTTSRNTSAPRLCNAAQHHGLTNRLQKHTRTKTFAVLQNIMVSSTACRDIIYPHQDFAMVPNNMV